MKRNALSKLLERKNLDKRKLLIIKMLDKLVKVSLWKNLKKAL